MYESCPCKKVVERVIIYLDHRRIQELHFADTPTEAVDRLYASIEEERRRPRSEVNRES